MLWHAAARVLPVTVRPLGGETVISYARRLAEANDLPATTIIRALGQLSHPSGYHLLDHDAWLNEQALGRLETYSGMSRPRLSQALPALRRGPSGLRQLPADRPALHFYRPWPPAQQACRRCTLRVSGKSATPALIQPGTSPLICRRDKRWLDPAAQYDLSGASEILVSHQRYNHLLAASDDKRWFTVNFSTAWQTTQWWARTAPDPFPELGRRWRTRARALAIPPAADVPAVVSFPEAVTLAEILTDLNWRRHVAMVMASDLGTFYNHVARSVGEQSCPSLPGDDPLRGWADGHRAKFAGIRDHTWAKAARHPQPFPEIRRFK